MNGARGGYRLHSKCSKFPHIVTSHPYLGWVVVRFLSFFYLPSCFVFSSFAAPSPHLFPTHLLGGAAVGVRGGVCGGGGVCARAVRSDVLYSVWLRQGTIRLCIINDEGALKNKYKKILGLSLNTSRQAGDAQATAHLWRCGPRLKHKQTKKNSMVSPARF